jgi:hypothetical protein
MTIVYLWAATDDGSQQVAVYISDAGRVKSVGMGGRKLHDRRSSKRSDRRQPKLPSATLSAIRDMACAMVAARSLGLDAKGIATVEIDL